MGGSAARWPPSAPGAVDPWSRRSMRVLARICILIPLLQSAVYYNYSSESRRFLVRHTSISRAARGSAAKLAHCSMAWRRYGRAGASIGPNGAGRDLGASSCKPDRQRALACSGSSARDHSATYTGNARNARGRKGVGRAVRATESRTSRISAGSRLYLGCISTVSRLYLAPRGSRRRYCPGRAVRCSL